MRTQVLIAIALAAGSTTVLAQRPIRPEIRPFAGAWVPTGPQRQLFNDAPMAGVQLALELKPTLHLVGTVGWVPAEYQLVGTAGPLASNNRANVVQYTAGVELGFVRPLGRQWELRPFAGIGAGARTYLYSSAGLNDNTCFASYGAAGTEFQLRNVALRFEARDNVFCFKSPQSGLPSRTRNDLGFSVGLAYHIR